MCGGEHVVDGGWRWRERWGGGVVEWEQWKKARGDEATLLLLLVFCHAVSFTPVHRRC